MGLVLNSTQNSRLSYDKHKVYMNTSMHSSRMHSARLLPVSPSTQCAGGVGGYAPGEVSAWGGCLLPGDLLREGVCSQGSSPRGVSAPGERCIPACTEADTPL